MALFVKNLLFSVLVPGTVAVYVPFLIVESRSPASILATALALPVLVVGAAIYAWCVWDFANFGRGTPAPIDAPRKLVARGLYRYTRNPMYLGVLTVILGWAILFQAGVMVVYAAVVGSVFHLVVVLYEERHLHRVFGDDYDTYCTRVGRWLPEVTRMRLVDRILGWCLVLLGCVHNFVAAPLSYDELSAKALWFVSAGLALWYAGFINLVRSYSAEPTRLLCIFSVLTNLSLLGFVLVYAVVLGNWATPPALALIGIVAGLTVFSVLK